MKKVIYKIKNFKTILLVCFLLTILGPISVYADELDYTIPSISTYNIQNLPESECTTTPTVVTDARDGQSYTVALLGDGNCWMTQNLRLGANTANPDNYQITLDPSTSNVETATTLTVYDLVTHGTDDSDKLCSGTYDSSTQTGTGEGYTTPCVHTSDDGSSVWYNYSAATAGTITGTNNNTEVSIDICPKGWRLPTHAENQTIGDSTATYVSVFGPVYGGIYSNGTLGNATTYGFWWSSMAVNGPLRYRLRYNSGSLYTDYSRRRDGIYVRCVTK